MGEYQYDTALEEYLYFIDKNLMDEVINGYRPLMVNPFNHNAPRRIGDMDFELVAPQKQSGS